MIDDQAVQLLTQLVAIPSISRDETKAVQFLVKQMRQLQFDQAYVDQAGSAVGIRENASQGAINRTLMLLGHIDTVAGWIEVRVEADRLYGRGSVDAKGPLCAFVVAAAKARIPAGLRLVVAGAVEEECATSRGARQIASDFVPNWCVIGEPSGADSLTLGYKGRLLVEYRLQTDEGHSAGPGSTPAELATAWWEHLRSYADQYNQSRPTLFAQFLPSLRWIHTSSDGLASRVEASVGCRLPPDFSPDEFVSFLDGISAGATVETHGFEPAFQAPRSGPLVRQFMLAMRSARLTTRYKLKTGTSDMNVVGPIWNCPIVAYGPGDSLLDHTPHEHLQLGEYLCAVEVLQSVIEQL